MEIGYTSEPVQKYSKAIQDVASLSGLKQLVSRYYEIAWDAAEVVEKMTDEDFELFKRCRAMEKSGEYSGDENQWLMGPLLMPETMFKVSIVAAQYGVPWGLAFIRLKEVGQIVGLGKSWGWAIGTLSSGLMRYKRKPANARHQPPAP